MSESSLNRIPVAILIDRDIVETLSGITKEAGYHVTIASVERAKRNYGNTAGHLKAVVHVGDDQARDDAADGGFKLWTRPYQIQVFVFDSDLADPADYRDMLEYVRADITKAMMADYTRGGNARNTEVSDPLEFDDVNDATGIIVNVDVTYDTDENDPCKLVPGA